jgi:hypothetical protein
MSTITLRMPAQMRKHVERNLIAETTGQRELLDACKALNLGKSNVSTDIELTNEALGAALDLAREWRTSDNGNNARAAASILKWGTPLYRPEQPKDAPKVWNSTALRSLSSLPGRGRPEGKVIWWGGKAGAKSPTPGTWCKVQVVYTGDGKYALNDAATAEELAVLTLASQLHWAPVKEESAAVEEDERELIVIVSCGAAKTWKDKAPAGEMYVGSYHRACRKAADALTADGGTVLILSAKYGLLGLDDEIENYDLRMGDAGSVNGSTLRQQVTMNGDNEARVIVLGSAPYVEMVREAWPDAEAPLSGGIGVQLKQLADIYKGEPETDEDEHQDQEHDEDQAAEVTLTKMRLSHLIVWEDRDFYFWYGGTAKGKAQPQTPMLVSINWHESKNGTNFIRSAETREIVAEAHSMSNVWGAQAPEENKARYEAAQAAQVEEPAHVEKTEPEPTPEPAPALKPKGRPVPQNWLDMCEEANTESARAWWRGYCDRYRRGEV